MNKMTLIHRAQEIVRRTVVPLYPLDKSISDMTPYEQAVFKQWVPVIAQALADAMAEEREA